MASGEIAYLLGDAFGQQIGTDPYPVLGGMKVFITEDGRYTNRPTGVNDIGSDSIIPEIVAVYGADGSRRTSLLPGLNIVVYSDGTTKKLLTK